MLLMWLKKRGVPQPQSPVETVPDAAAYARLEATASNLWSLIQGGAQFPGFKTNFDGQRASLRRDHTRATGTQVNVLTDSTGLWHVEQASWAPGLEEGGQGLVIWETVDRPVSALDPVSYTRETVELAEDGSHAGTTQITRELLDVSMGEPTDPQTAANIAATLGSVIDIAKL
jgi:hypothetical protein